MSNNVFTFHQGIFKSSTTDDVDVIELSDTDLTESILDDFLVSAEDSVGIACAFGPRCRLCGIAIASGVLVLFIRFTINKRSAKDGRCLLRDKILCNSDVSKLAFDMEWVATSLYTDHNLHIVHAIDLQSLLAKSKGRQDGETFMSVLGGQQSVDRDAVVGTFVGVASSSAEVLNVALRAWASGRARNFHKMDGVPRINTAKVND